MLRTGLLLFVAGVALSAPIKTDNPKALWDEYKLKHSKAYSPAEDVERFRLFLERVQIINEHNARFDAGETTYTMGLTPSADWTVAEMMRRNGYVQREEENTETETEEVEVSTEGLPATVDWVGKGAVTGVKDQGQCGSCWSFGTTGTTEGQHFLAGNKLVSLSEQNLIDCDTTLDHGCNGGLPENAYKYIIKNGIDTEASYPYKGRQGSCQFNKNNVAATLSGQKSVTKNSESALQSAVANVGPIAVGIDASHISFQLYTGGVYNEPKCSSTRLDHAVLVVGYGTDNGTPYWKVKNSWGTSWGEKGYIQMSRNKNDQCGIAHDATYPVV